MKSNKTAVIILLLSLCGQAMQAQHLNGTGGIDTVEITGNQSGTLNSTPFSGISTIDAAGGTDTATTNAPILVRSFAGAFTSQNILVANVENVSSANGNLLSSGTSTFNLTGSINEISVNVLNITGITNVFGTVGAETLNGTSGNDTFTLSTSGIVNSYGMQFESFDEIRGRNGNDTLNISSTGTIVLSETFSEFESANLNGGALDLTGLAGGNDTDDFYWHNDRWERHFDR